MRQPYNQSKHTQAYTCKYTYIHAAGPHTSSKRHIRPQSATPTHKDGTQQQAHTKNDAKPHTTTSTRHETDNVAPHTSVKRSARPLSASALLVDTNSNTQDAHVLVHDKRLASRPLSASALRCREDAVNTAEDPHAGANNRHASARPMSASAAQVRRSLSRENRDVRSRVGAASAREQAAADAACELLGF